MTDRTTVVPATPTRPPMPSITASVLAESRLILRAVTAWLTKG